MNKEILIQAPKPHSKKQELIMGCFKIPGLREIWVCMGTKFGKSLGFATAITMAAIERPNTKWRWVAPILDQAKEVGMDYCRRLLPPEPHTEVNLSGPFLKIPYIDTKIEFWHTNNPKSLEGPGIYGYCLDEVSKMPYEAYAAARTTLTFTKGPLAGFSYPYGKNWFHKKCMEAKAEMDWALKNGVQPEKVFFHARTIDNPMIDPAVVVNAKRELPERLFRQYYLAEFVDDASVFVGFRNCYYGDVIDIVAPRQKYIVPNAKELDVVIAADWAKLQDWTVFGAFTFKDGKPKMVGFDRFHGMNYMEAVKQLWWFAKEFKSVGIIYHDKTGVGEAIDEMVGQIGLPAEGVVFTGNSKSAMVNSLMVAIQKQEIELLNWTELDREMDAYEVQVNDLGKPKYSAPAGKNDDIVAMLLLANAALCEYAGKGMEVRIIEDLPDQSPSMQKWFNDILEESGNDAAHLFGALRR